MSDAPNAAIAISGLTHIYRQSGDRSVTAVDDLTLIVEEGQFFTLVGPSGCGKTSTLRCVAGLERPDRGEIALAGAPVVGPGRFVPPEQRQLGMVFQDYAVWPHLSVFENVAFPLRVQKVGVAKKDLEAAVHEALQLVGLDDFASRASSRLSGGQQQRLSLARALVRKPKVLLLDEPLSNLDAKLRTQMRAELRLIQRRLGVTTLYVTHDQIEALSMSNVIAVMKDGRVEQLGTPRQIYENPKTVFVADFIGSANVIHGTVREAAGPSGVVVVETPLGVLRSRATDSMTSGDSVALAVRPEAIHLRALDEEAKFDGVCSMQGEVILGLYVGEAIDYTLACGATEIRVRGKADRRFRAGSTVWVDIPSTAATTIAV